ncbi:MAG: glutathione binding-like protein, partial [Hyphomicrobiaceae bacterium]
WLDTELSDGRTFVTGDRFTLADITGMTALKICDIVDTAVPTELTFVTAWAQRLRGRPSWSA